jgi:hypothetical protein
MNMDKNLLEKIKKIYPDLKISTERKHTEKYELPPKEIKHEIGKEEKLRAWTTYELVDRENENIQKTVCFYITTNEKEAKMKILMATHGKHGYDNEPSQHIATYPKEEANELIKEMNGIAMTMLIKAETDKKANYRPSTTDQVLIAQVEKETSQEATLAGMIAEINDRKTFERLQIIFRTLNLAPTLLSKIRELSKTRSTDNIEKIVKEMVKEPEKITTLIPKGTTILEKKRKSINIKKEREKAAKKDKKTQEKSLIEKFGKEKIKKLAEEIGYKGEMINKTGKKSKEVCPKTKKI